MQFGAAMFFTDYSMSAAELARACEERGFESVWAPEHSHIPLARNSPFPSGGELPKQYSQVMDPFVTLSAALPTTASLSRLRSAFAISAPSMYSISFAGVASFVTRSATTTPLRKTTIRSAM